MAIGGGTGLSTLLSGLKRYSSHITAIVTVADDGGSSGVLRRELGVLPPGDIRNCLAALSTEEPLLTRLFQYRFSAGSGLEGHSFGNLFLSALTAITGNLETAITASSRVLAVQGQVVPATNVDVQLWAELENGQRIEGESNIGHAPSPIVRLGCSPERPPALPRALGSDRQCGPDRARAGQPLHIPAAQSAGAGTGERHQTQQGTQALHLQPDDATRRNRWPGRARSHASDRSATRQPGH